MKINSLEEACTLRGYDINTALPDVSKMPEKLARSSKSFTSLEIISEASWQGKEPDWNNWDERKWYPVWDMEVDDNNPTGFRFDGSDLAYTDTVTGSGSRLCFPSKEDSDFHAEKFIDLFRDVIKIAK